MTPIRGGIKMPVLPVIIIRCLYSIMRAEKNWNQPKVDFLVQRAEVFDYFKLIKLLNCS